MAVARSMKEREFILSCDKELPPEQQTIFFVKPLSSKEQVSVDDLVTSDENAVMEVSQNDKTVKMPFDAGRAERRYQMLLHSLVGWKNYKDVEGNEIEFKLLTPDERISFLFPEWRAEIGDYIESLNYPVEAVLKN